MAASNILMGIKTFLNELKNLSGTQTAHSSYDEGRQLVKNNIESKNKCFKILSYLY